MEERILSATEITMQYNAHVYAMRVKHFVDSLDPAQAMDWKEAHRPNKEDVARTISFFGRFIR